ncbi:MAG: DUF1501 domain-containing protein [Terriglobia bacterium]
MDNRHVIPSAASRREFLHRAGNGFGAIALAALGMEQSMRAASSSNPLAPKVAHHAARAKHVIFLFMQGGPSQMDLFDYKPHLAEFAGKPFELPANYEAPGLNKTKLMGPISSFRHYGQSGLYMSEWFPMLGNVADDLCVLRAMQTDTEAHATAVRQINTGAPVQVRPSMGAWIVYGLGTENANMPGFITIRPSLTGDGGSPQNFGSAFLPAIYQGTPVGLAKSEEAAAIDYSRNEKFSPGLQGHQLEILRALNQKFLAQTPDPAMEGMIESFELAFRMQSQAPGLMDLSKESKETQTLYGIDDKETRDLGQQCLLARRLVEAGVRFVQVNDSGWDHHVSIRESLPKKCRQVDKPIAALISDLKARGLLDETLVIWGGEFGRTPFDQDLSLGKAPEENRGREHNPRGFTMWLAGGGVKRGLVYGETDDFAFQGVDGKVHIHDLHATILHLLGLNHESLTYRYSGRDFRLTDIYGRVVTEILA